MSGKSVGMGVVGAAVGFLLPPGNVAGAVALGSAGFAAGAALDGAEAGVKVAKLNRDLANQQADETLQRASENTKSIMRDADTFHGNQVSSMVRGGVDVGSESSLVAMENAHANFKRQAFLGERDASLAAQRIRAKAQNDVNTAKSKQTATQISAGISVLGAGASAFGSMTKSPGGGGGGGMGTSDYGSAGSSSADFSNYA